MEKQGRITILGLGNILLEDEGFGVHFIRYIAGKYRFGGNVQVIDGGTLGYRLLDTICSAGRVIAIDVIKVDDEPGSIYRFTRAEMELRMPEPTSAHEVEFLDVLYQAELMGELPECAFLCVVPKSYGTMKLEMTEPMKDAFPAMERLLLDELKNLGTTWKEVC